MELLSHPSKENKPIFTGHCGQHYISDVSSFLLLATLYARMESLSSAKILLSRKRRQLSSSLLELLLLKQQLFLLRPCHKYRGTKEPLIYIILCIYKLPHVHQSGAGMSRPVICCHTILLLWQKGLGWLSSCKPLGVFSLNEIWSCCLKEWGAWKCEESCDLKLMKCLFTHKDALS